MGRKPFYQKIIRLEYHFLNIEQFWMCWSFYDQTQTPFFGFNLKDIETSCTNSNVLKKGQKCMKKFRVRCHAQLFGKVLSGLKNAFTDLYCTFMQPCRMTFSVHLTIDKNHSWQICLKIRPLEKMWLFKEKGLSNKRNKGFLEEKIGLK